MGQSLLWKAALCLSLLACVLSLETPFLPEDRDHLQKVASVYVQEGLGGLGSHNILFVSSVLARLKSDGILAPNKAGLCALAAKGIASGITSNRSAVVAHGLEALGVLGCAKDIFDSSDAVVMLQKHAVSTSLHEIHNAIQGLHVLAKDYSVTWPDSVDCDRLILSVLEMQTSDGTFRNSADGVEDGTVLNTGYALETLASLAARSSVRKHTFDAFGAKVENMLKVLVESLENDASLMAITLALRGLRRLAGALKVQYHAGEDAVRKVTDFALSLKHTANIADAYYLLEALELLASHPTAKPLLVSLVRPNMHIHKADSPKDVISVKVTDVHGAEVSGAKVSSVLVMRGDEREHANLQVVSKGSSVFDARIDPNQSGGSGLSVGTYTVVLDASAPGYTGVRGAHRTLRVLGSVALSELEIIEGLRGQEDPKAGKRQVADFPLGAADRLFLHQNSSLWISFHVSPIVPVQTFVRFQTSSVSAVFRAKPVPKVAGKLLCMIDLWEVGESDFRFVSGRYAVDVLVGDAILSDPIAWEIAVADIQFSQAALRSPGEIEMAPEMTHVFKAPEKRPPAVVSIVFTSAIGGCFFVLLYLLMRVGANVSNFPMGEDFIHAAFFQCSIAAVLMLCAIYWIGMSVFELLFNLVGLAPFLIGFGSRALADVAKCDATSS